MTLVAGVDCSTQSTKVVICDAADGTVVRQGSARHPDATEVDPQVWWQAFTDASSGLLEGVEAVAVGGQQHGMVVLDDSGAVVRPALLWNDTRSAGAAAALVAELGGPQAWADAVGSVPLASFTVAKLRWFAEAEPELARRAASVVLPHDWLTSRLCHDTGTVCTDRGDASGTGYWSPVTGAYRRDLLELAFGRPLELPRVAGPAELVGRTASGMAVAAGTGDNMAAALGLGLESGDMVVSLGTSGTAFAVSDVPTQDVSGAVAGLADATGRFLPLVCTLNAARVLVAAASVLEVDLSTVDSLALQAESGAGGLTMLPYLDGERTPDLPDASGLLAGITRSNATPANIARAAVEGMLCGLADGVDALGSVGVVPRRISLIGGASASRAVRALAPALLGAPVVLPDPGEYVAWGAARQAAWALAGGAEPPAWPVPGRSLDAAPATGATGVRARYAAVRTGTADWLTRARG